MQNFRFIIKGRVQGVFYRKNICENALKQDFNGYVKNLSDGSVEACVTTSEDNIDKFITILKNGSTMSNVENIETLSCAEKFTKPFEIRY